MLPRHARAAPCKSCSDMLAYGRAAQHPPATHRLSRWCDELLMVPMNCLPLSFICPPLPLSSASERPAGRDMNTASMHRAAQGCTGVMQLRLRNAMLIVSAGSMVAPGMKTSMDTCSTRKRNHARRAAVLLRLWRVNRKECISSAPMIPLIGVRSSWLITDRKLSF